MKDVSKIFGLFGLIGSFGPFPRYLALVVVFLMDTGFGLHAQTFEELFKQQETQRKYLVIQLGALRMQSGLLQEGKAIAEFGLNAVQEFRNGEWRLHDDFFEGYRQLGPLATQAMDQLMPLHPELVASRILRSQRYWMSRSPDSQFLEWSEALHAGMLDVCQKLGTELELALSQEMRLEDAQRAEWIEKIGLALHRLSSDLARLQESGAYRLKFGQELNYSLSQTGGGY